jgi:hypothetical protein
MAKQKAGRVAVCQSMKIIAKQIVSFRFYDEKNLALRYSAKRFQPFIACLTLHLAVVDL